MAEVAHRRLNQPARVAPQDRGSRKMLKTTLLAAAAVSFVALGATTADAKRRPIWRRSLRRRPLWWRPPWRRAGPLRRRTSRPLRPPQLQEVRRVLARLLLVRLPLLLSAADRPRESLESPTAVTTSGRSAAASRSATSRPCKPERLSSLGLKRAAALPPEAAALYFFTRPRSSASPSLSTASAAGV